MAWILIQDKPRSMMLLDDIGKNVLEALHNAPPKFPSAPPHPPNDTFYGNFQGIELIGCVNDDDIEGLLEKVKKYQRK